MTIGVGIIGYGKIGSGHAAQAEDRGLKLKAVYDPTKACREQAAADHPGIRVYEKLEDFLADNEVNLVIVATPNDSHAALSISCLEAGKHVVCEKPMCMNAQEAQRVQQCVEKSGKFFAVHQNRRWDEHFLRARLAVESGQIGRLLESKIISNKYGPGTMHWGTQLFYPPWRAEKAYGGGMLFDWGAHWLDHALLLHRGQGVVAVYSQLFNRSLKPGQNAEDGFKVLLTFADNSVSHVEFQMGTPAEFHSKGWIVNGTDGGYVQGTLYKIIDGKSEKQEWEPQLPASGYWQNVRDMINGVPGVAPLVPVAESVRVMKLIDAAYASQQSGNVVRFTTPL